jgi:glyoxylase-like metal-dependent hydrolase (beta-lactamase superfamily II)
MTETVTKRLTLGEVSVARVMELEGTFATGAIVIPDSDRDTWDAHRGWLAPDHWNPATDEMQGCLQSYLLRSAGRTILIDTGAGNFKDRPYFPSCGGLDTDFLANLARAGARAEDVDVVVCTHLHVDHVGWNTVLVDGEWMPTFPNATYFFAREDVEYWNPAGPFRPKGAWINHNVFEDSVEPVLRAGQAQLWSGACRIDENLTLEAAPGHTPGLGVVRLSSGSDRALFVGDLLHSPIQLVRPEWNSCFCEDPDQARATRTRLLGEAADTNTLVVPAHFGGVHAVEVERADAGFRVKHWAAFNTDPDVRARAR